MTVARGRCAPKGRCRPGCSLPGHSSVRPGGARTHSRVSTSRPEIRPGRGPDPRRAGKQSKIENPRRDRAYHSPGLRSFPKPANSGLTPNPGNERTTPAFPRATRPLPRRASPEGPEPVEGWDASAQNATHGACPGPCGSGQ